MKSVKPERAEVSAFHHLLPFPSAEGLAYDFEHPLTAPQAVPKVRSPIPTKVLCRQSAKRSVKSRAQSIGKGGTTPLNTARIGRDWVPGSGALAESIRGVRKTVHHESVHLWLNRTFSMFGKPALYMKLGAYKRSYMLRYLEEAAAEARSQFRVPRRADEVVAYKFPFGPTYEVTLQQIGTEAKGILLGPVVIGGATYHAYYGLAHADR